MPGRRAVNGLEIPFQPTDPKKNKTKKQRQQQKKKQKQQKPNVFFFYSMSIFPSTNMHSLDKAKSLLKFFMYCSAKWEDHTQTQQFESLRLFTI